MTRRFTDTDKWQDTFFRKLSPNAKLLFLFIIDNCDAGGFWETDLDVAAFHIGVDADNMKEAFREIESRFLSDGKFVWARNFIKHQKNSKLNLNNNAHVGVIRCIVSHKKLTDKVLEYLKWDIKELIEEYR